MAIHMSENEKKQLVQGFNDKAETNGLFSTALDTEFSGVYTVHVHSLVKEELQDYDKSANPASASRYGTPKDVQDEKQTFTMTDDKSLSLVIDKGNNAGQFNQKKSAEVMKYQTENVIAPYLDKLRLKKWAEGAGVHREMKANISNDEFVQEIVAAHTSMVDNNVPDNLMLVIKRARLDAIRFSSYWATLDSLGGKTLPSGFKGEFDGMPVKTIAASKFPAGVDYMIVHKESIIAPGKIQDFKVHIDPPGLSGDLIEFRMIQDAFVLGSKCDGVLAGCANGTVVATPAIAKSSGNYAITCGTSGATIKYTTDGTDPRYSVDALTYSAAIPAPAAGTTIRACATKDGLYNSNLAELKV